MPFANEHAARQTDPDRYQTFRRTHPEGWPAGVDAIMGLRMVAGKRTSEIQSVRFAADRWTPGEAREWLQAHDFKIGQFEAATGDRADAADPFLAMLARRRARRAHER